MISVVIPTREREPLLDQALASLAEQTYADFEVVVVNDGGASVESTVRAWQQKLRLTLLELPSPVGPARARNVGIERARGEYLAFLDDDDLFLPGHLASAHQALVGGDLDFVYLAAVVSGRRVRSLPPDWLSMHHKAYEFDERLLYVANYIHTGSVVVRNFGDSDVRFDESLPVCEDWDLWLALRHRLGYRTGLVNSFSCVYHQVPGTPGLVAEGQAAVPSPFSVSRRQIYAKWPVADRQVIAYREWMICFDDYCNDQICSGRPVPQQVFDRALQQLHRNFAAGRNIDRAIIPGLFLAS